MRPVVNSITTMETTRPKGLIGFRISEGIASLIIISSYFLPCYIVRILGQTEFFTPLELIKKSDGTINYISLVLLALPVINVIVKFFSRSAWLSWLSLAALIIPLAALDDSGVEVAFGIIPAVFGGITMIVSLLISWFMNIKRPRLMLRISLFCLLVSLTILVIFLNLNTSSTVVIISMIAANLFSVALFSTIVALIRIPFCKEEKYSKLNDILSTRNLIFVATLPILLILISCFGGTRTKGADRLEYIAVQFEKGDNWSIVNGNGKVIVKEEYNSKDQISPITPEGIYWVKSFVDEKIRFYSIKSPRKPISAGEYTNATVFFNNYSFVCDGKNPIQCIDTKGRVKNTLSKEIHQIYVPEQAGNRILYKGKNGLFGYLNNNGDIVIKAQYPYAEHFGDNVALVKRNNGDIMYIIDENGKELGKIDVSRYCLVSQPATYSDGLLATKENNYKLTYLNKEGKVAFVPNKNYQKSHFSNFVGGYAIISDEHKRGVGVIDRDGETIIRLGKYHNIANMGNGTFAVTNEERKIGIVDTDDNIMIDCLYDDLQSCTIGGNYIMEKNRYWYFVSPDGKRINNVEVYKVETRNPTSVIYHNLEKIAKDLVSQISTKGYAPIIGKKNVIEIAKSYKLQAEKQNRKVRYLDLPKFKADIYDVAPYVNFSNRIVMEKTHIETVDDGWFSYEQTVSDGWEWNDEAILSNIYIELSGLSYEINIIELMKEVGKQLENKGFKPIMDFEYEAKNGDKYIHINIGSDRDESIYISIYPYDELPVTL